MARRLIACLIVAFILIFSCQVLAQAPAPPGQDGPPMPPGGPPPPPPPPGGYEQLAPPQQGMPTPPPAPPGNDQGGNMQAEQRTPQPPIIPNDGSQSRQNQNQRRTRPPQLPKPGSSVNAPGRPATTAAPKASDPMLPTENVTEAPPGTGRNWPTFRGDVSHTGATEEQLGFPLRLAWKFITDVTPNNPSSPAVVDGVIYFCSGSRLYAVNAETGSLKWRYPAEEYLTSMVKSSPAVGDDLVYFGAGDGKLYAITKDTGTQAWSFSTKGIMNSSPTLVDGVIYVGSSDDHLYALDAMTGQEKWVGGFRTHDDVACSPAYLDGLIYFLSNDMVLYAAHTSSGRVKWQVRVGSWSPASTPVLSDNIVYLAFGNTLQTFQAKSGRLKWGLKFLNDITTIPAVSNGVAYLADRSGKVSAVSSAGKLKWTADLGYPAYGSPIVAGDTVIVSANKGTLAAFDTETGSLKWKYFVQPSNLDYGKLRYVNLASGPVVSNGTLYVLADDGALHAFRHDAPDTTPPDVTPLAPSRDSLTPGSPPVEFAVSVFDEGSGLQEATFQLSVDGQPVEHKFIPERGIVFYKTDVKTGKQLADGQHSASFAAYDWAGNKAETTWYFTVNNRIKRAQKAAPPPVDPNAPPK